MHFLLTALVILVLLSAAAWAVWKAAAEESQQDYHTDSDLYEALDTLIRVIHSANVTIAIVTHEESTKIAQAIKRGRTALAHHRKAR